MKRIFWILLAIVLFLSLKPKSEFIDLSVNDKFGHTMAYFALMFSSVYAFRKIKPYLLACGLTLLGITIELLQSLIPGRFSSLLDLLANTSGIVLAWLFVSIFGVYILRILKSIKLTD